MRRLAAYEAFAGFAGYCAGNETLVKSFSCHSDLAGQIICPLSYKRGVFRVFVVYILFSNANVDTVRADLMWMTDELSVASLSSSLTAFRGLYLSQHPAGYCFSAELFVCAWNIFIWC